MSRCEHPRARARVMRVERWRSSCRCSVVEGPVFGNSFPPEGRWRGPSVDRLVETREGVVAEVRRRRGSAGVRPVDTFRCSFITSSYVRTPCGSRRCGLPPCSAQALDAFVTILALERQCRRGMPCLITHVMAPGAKSPHELVFQRQVERLSPGALTADCRAAGLFDAPALVALRAPTVESADLAHLGAVWSHSTLNCSPISAYFSATPIVVPLARELGWARLPVAAE